MPNYLPDPGAGLAHGYVLPPRTRLWRVHNKLRSPCVFNRGLAGVDHAGGRFDATAAEPYGYLYASTEDTTAVAERFLRGMAFDRTAARLLGVPALANRRLSAVEVTTELRLTTLLAATDLAALGQDDWLVQAEPAEFGDTRAWAQAIRKLDPGSQGIVWQSRRDRPHRTMLLFEDRCGPDGPLRPLDHWSIDLDTHSGIELLREMLRPYYVSIDA
jgi:hypothetical protein